MCRCVFVLAGAVMLSGGMPFPAAGAFEILSHSIAVDHTQRVTRFSLTFNELPNLFTVDEFDRPANAFQYWYDAEPGGFEFAGDDVVVIRGPEIRRGGDLPVRESLNETGEEFPDAEGWGASRGEVPFDLQGTTLEFTVPWGVLGETDEKWSYRLLAFEFGSQTSDVAAIFIDLPTPLEMGAVALPLMMIGLGMQRRLAR
jgi:hypothetical protein